MPTSNIISYVTPDNTPSLLPQKSLILTSSKINLSLFLEHSQFHLIYNVSRRRGGMKLFNSNEATLCWSVHTCQWLLDLNLAETGPDTCRFKPHEFLSSDFLSNLNCGPVTDFSQTESGANESAMHMHRCAKNRAFGNINGPGKTC